MADETTNAAVEETQTAAPAEAKAEETKKEVPAKFKKIVEEIETMSVLELNELVKVFEDRFGVSATAVAVAGPAAGAGEAAEEKSTADVELADGGANKIALIKVVKEALALGLKEAKDLVDAAPSMLKAGMKKEEAEDLKKKIEEAGGKVTLK
jgi:large subunit ribosomal protein L7/L12